MVPCNGGISRNFPKFHIVKIAGFDSWVFFASMFVNLCREWNKRLTADQAQKMYEQAVKMEQEFGEYFTGISCWL